MPYGRSPRCRTGSARVVIPPLVRPGRPTCGVAGGIGLLVLLSETIPAAGFIVAPEQGIVNKGWGLRRTFCRNAINGARSLGILARKCARGAWRGAGDGCIIAVSGRVCERRTGGGAAAGRSPAPRRPRRGAGGPAGEAGRVRLRRMPAPCTNRKGSVSHE